MKFASRVAVRGVAAARLIASVRLRIAAVVALALVAVGITASSASAYDEMWLNNATNVSFTQGSWCIIVGPLACTAEDGQAWVKGAVLPAGRSNPGIWAILQVSGWPPQAVSFTTTWYPSGSSNYFTVWAEDPDIGPAFVQCTGSVPGFSCSVVDSLYAYLQQDGSSSTRRGSAPIEARFWSGLAPVRRSGIALVPVASYSTRRRGTVRERVVLRNRSGKVIGRGEKTMHVGQTADVEVRLTSGVARLVANGKNIEVRASVANAHGTVGIGQTTTMALTKLTPALGRLLHLPASLTN